MTQSLFDPDPERDVARLVANLAAPAPSGHYDELRAPDGALRPGWRKFFGHLGAGGFRDMSRRRATIGRQVREDGITYNVYSEDGLSERPWSLDLLPFLINAEEWSQLESGLAQRAALMSAIMRDIYGPQRLLAENLLPPALVFGHPGYLRPLVGSRPAGGTFLHIMAFDVARASDGRWWVVGNRTQAPSGLGYALQNRLIVSRLFPEAFRRMKVQRLAASFRGLLDTLQRCSPCGDAELARLVLLTPGPYNETYFEHAYLARYLGIPLVEGSDLTVRDDRVFLRALHGLLPVHGILRRLDDDFCDPLELRQDSTLGVPGLLQSIRAGKVLVANALGSGFLESPAINGFLPAIARRELGEDLRLPSLASWWCGEEAAFRQVAEDLTDKVVKRTYPPSSRRPGLEAVIGTSLDASQSRALRERIESDPDAHTVQAYLPLPQAPTWREGALVPRAAMVRVFTIRDGDRWHVMPGGLTRVAQREQRIVSMQRGGASQDTWVQTAGAVDTFSMLPTPLRAAELVVRRRTVSSRAAENLFWMGRYSERCDHSVRLARAALTLLGDDMRAPSPVLAALATMCEEQGLVPAGVPAPSQSVTVFERTLISGLADAKERPSVAFALDALERAAGHIRDRLSADHWRLIAATAERFRADCATAAEKKIFSPDEAVSILGHLAIQLSAITGAQIDHMTRDDGWRLMTIGRQIERLGVLARTLQLSFSTGAVARDDGFDLLLQLFDSTITYRALYQRRLEAAPLIDLLVQEHANPRSLRGVARRVVEQIERLGAPAASELLLHLPTQRDWPSLDALCQHEGVGPGGVLLNLCERLADGTRALSDDIGERYFSHASAEFRMVHA